MRYTAYWIFLILGVVLISIVMEDKSDTNTLIACFIWGVLVSMFFDFLAKRNK